MTRSVVTIGNFDGVHLGHAAILERARRVADRRGAVLKALTFEPHPATILRPDSVPPRIVDRDEKLRLLREGGADEVIVMKPDAALLALDPAAFVERMVETHRPHAFVEGRDFRFGRDRRGDIAMLSDAGPGMDFVVEVVDPVEITLSDQLVARASSSLARWLIARGRVRDAALCLGRPVTLTGEVVEGDRRGRTIGVPTANLDRRSLDGLVIPADGVYAGHARLTDGRVRAAAISIGIKPTFKGALRCVEAHLLDFDGDLYGQTVSLSALRWVRDQVRFANTEDLRAQLTRDVDATRDLWLERASAAGG
ncbi:MAG: riboflavin biosynthesis protein RibF [Phycisphaeraceae bacterium]|nr:riboflavin biosynthesis protein RibF [Phycisphaeraceae bacterium]